MDSDGSGEISAEELVMPLLAMGSADTIEQVNQIIQSADVSGSGEVAFPEFCTLLTNSASRTFQSMRSFIEKSNSSNDGLSLQTTMPIQRRKDILDALMSFGHSNTLRLSRKDAELRKKHLDCLSRAEVALEFYRNLPINDDEQELCSAQEARSKIASTSRKLLHVQKKKSAQAKSKLHHPQLLSELDTPRQYHLQPTSNIQKNNNAAINTTNLSVDCSSVTRNPPTANLTIPQKAVQTKNPPANTKKRRKRLPKVITYSYAPGEDIPHKTIVHLPTYQQPQPIKFVPRQGQGSSLGIIPKCMKRDIQSHLKMLRLDLNGNSNSNDATRRRNGQGAGRWGYA